MTNANEGQTHSDPVAEAEGKMRAEFEAATVVPYGVEWSGTRYVAKEGSGDGHWVSAKVYQHDYEMWQVCAAQSAETIAWLEQEYVKLHNAHCELEQSFLQRLAAAQFSNERMREALQVAFIALDGGDDTRPSFEVVKSALAQPSDTSALDAYVAERMKELVPHGWKVVPIEPTEEMIDAAHAAEHCGNIEPHFTNAYQAMLEAAPLPPSPKQEKE